MRSSTPCISTNKSALFNGNADESLKALAKKIAEDHILTAGSLEQLRAAVKENPNVLDVSIQVPTTIAGKKCVLEGTLEQLAMILLDHTLVTADKNNTDLGAAEVLREFYSSDKLLDASKNAGEVVVLPSKDDIEFQETMLLQANYLMKEGKRDEAVSRVKHYMQSITPDVIKDNGCFLKLLLLHSIAFNQCGNPWINPSANEFRQLIITVIQQSLPPRILQELFRGHRQFIQGERDIPRLDSDKFAEHAKKLNENAYGATGNNKPDKFMLGNDGVYFEMLYKSIKSAAFNLCDQTARPISRLRN